MSDSDRDPSLDPFYVSPAFGRKKQYPYKSVTGPINPSILGDENPSPVSDSALSPEEEEIIARQSEESKRRFLANPVPGAPAALRSGLSYEEAKIVFLAQRNGKEGKPTKLTPERLQIISDNIRRGTPRYIAAGLAGISEATLTGWLSQGEIDILNGIDSEYSRCAYEIVTAERDLEARLANKWVKIVTEPTTKRKTVYREKVLEDGQVIRYAESDTVEEQGDGNWQGIAEFMSRRMSERWKKTERIEQTGANGGPIQVQQATIDVGKLSVEERKVLFGIVKREVEKQVGAEGEAINVSRETIERRPGINPTTGKPFTAFPWET